MFRIISASFFILSVLTIFIDRSFPLGSYRDLNNYVQQASTTALVPTQLPLPTAIPVLQTEIPVTQRQIDDLRNQMRDQRLEQIGRQADATLSFANQIIQWSGILLTLFATIVAVVAGVVGFFGVREYRQLRQLRSETELAEKQLLQDVEIKLQEQRDKLNDMNNLFEAQIQDQTKKLDAAIQASTDRLAKDTEVLERTFVTLMQDAIAKNTKEQNTSFEDEINRLSQRFEKESQTFMETSYNFGIAAAAYKEGDNVKAIEYFNNILKIRPHDPKVLYRIGRAYTNLEQMDKAIASFDKIIASDPDNADALRGLAACYRFVDRKKAIAYTQRSIELDPNDFETYDYLGLLYRDEKMIDEAIQQHELALKLYTRADTYFFLALLHTRKNELERAKAYSVLANQTLEREEELDRIRPVWAVLIRWSKHLLDNQFNEALECCKDLKQYLTTPRVTKVVWGHMTYLMEGLGVTERAHEYRIILDVEI